MVGVATILTDRVLLTSELIFYKIGDDGLVYLLTQIRNIRKTILPAQLPSTVSRCVNTHHFRHEAHTCKPCSFISRLTLYTPQPSVRLGELGW